MSKIDRIDKAYDDWTNAHEKYIALGEQLRELLVPYIDFKFFVQYLPSDGYVILHEEMQLNVRVNTIINVIKTGERITDEYVDKYGE